MLNRCRNCNHEAVFSTLYNDRDLLKCGTCAAYQFVGPLGNLGELYDEDYYNGSEYINYELAAQVYRRNFERKLAVIRKYLPELAYDQMRVLEIGSATGDFLEVLREKGVVNMWGVEASEFARRRASERGFHVLDPFAEGYKEQVKEFCPNVVCAWDVWEHLERPADVFSELLNENPTIKMVALSTVDSGALLPRLKGKTWRQFHPPTHLNYPTKRSFEEYFRGAGFRVVANTAFGYYRPLADYLSLFMKTEWLNKLPFLFKIPLHLNLFDIQMVIAKRE